MQAFYKRKEELQHTPVPHTLGRDGARDGPFLGRSLLGVCPPLPTQPPASSPCCSCCPVAHPAQARVQLVGRCLPVMRRHSPSCLWPVLHSSSSTPPHAALRPSGWGCPSLATPQGGFHGGLFPQQVKRGSPSPHPPLCLFADSPALLQTAAPIYDLCSLTAAAASEVRGGTSMALPSCRAPFPPWCAALSAGSAGGRPFKGHEPR